MEDILTRHITRDKLARVFKSHEAIKLIEDLTRDVGQTIPDSIVNNSDGIANATQIATAALQLAGQAMMLAGESADADAPMVPPGRESVAGASAKTASVTVTVPWPGSLEFTGDVAFPGLTTENMVLCSVAPHLDADENDTDMLSISAMSALAGSAVATIKLAFSELTSGPIKLNLMAA